MRPGLRRFALTAHVSFSVGWLGAVASFLALAIAAVTSRELDLMRGAYFAMAVTGWYVIVPFCLGSLITGLISALGTPWGLFRHYWVLVKFLLTAMSALILFGFTQTLTLLGDLAADPTASIAALRDLKQSPVLHAGGGLLVLLATTTIAVYKPWGLTRYGRRKGVASAPTDEATASLPLRAYLLLGLLGVVLLFLVLHLIEGGPVRH